MMRRCRPVFILFIILFWCCPVGAQGKAGVLNLEIEGNAVINQNDAAGARDGAIQDALQRAILEAASNLLSLPVQDKKFLPVKSEIIERQDRYISNYKITAENIQAQAYAVTVNVAVNLPDLQNDLASAGFLKSSGAAGANAIVSLNIKGIKKYSDLSSLTEFLKKRVKMVRNVCPRSFEWQQARLELEISGTVLALADELGKTGQFMLDNDRINKNQITVNLLPGKRE